MTWTAKLEPDGYWYIYDDNDEGNSFFETKDADRARLIATAPALLELAMWVVDHFEGTDAKLGEWARDLVAKATGSNTGLHDDRTAASHTADPLVNHLLTALKVAKANLQPLGDSPALDIICSAIERGEKQ